MPISMAKQHCAHHGRREVHAHALEVEHADGDKIAGMNAVVEAEAEPLDLLVAGKTQLIADMMADGLGEIVLHHGEKTAKDADGQKNDRRRQQRIFGDLAGGTARHGRLCLVHRMAQKPGDHQLQGCGHERGADGKCRLPGMTQCHVGYSDQGEETSTPACRIHVRQRIGTIRGTI